MKAPRGWQFTACASVTGHCYERKSPRRSPTRRTPKKRCAPCSGRLRTEESRLPSALAGYIGYMVTKGNTAPHHVTHVTFQLWVLLELPGDFPLTGVKGPERRQRSF